MKWELLPFTRNNISVFTNAVRQAFLMRFSAFGCIHVPQVAISSGFDPTVRFIGSHISVLKPYLKQRSLPSKGLVCLQDCVRTQNLGSLGNIGFSPLWGSFFQSLGVLTPPGLLNAVAAELLKFFIESLRCSRTRIVARVSSEDTDLLRLCHEHFHSGQIEIDTRPRSTYRHFIGEENVTGRNMDIAIRSATCDDTDDIGNIILLERNGETLAVELAFGTSAIACRLLGLAHVLDCHPVPMIGSTGGLLGVRRQLEDIIITSTALYRDGLRPSNRDNRTRILKKYLSIAPGLSRHLGVSVQDLKEIASTYAALEYDCSNATIGEMIFGDIH